MNIDSIDSVARLFVPDCLLKKILMGLSALVFVFTAFSAGAIIFPFLGASTFYLFLLALFGIFYPCENKNVIGNALKRWEEAYAHIVDNWDKITPTGSFFSTDTNLLEERVISRQTVSNGGGMSVRLGGVRLGSGVSKSESVSVKGNIVVASGTLKIAKDEIIFVGDKKSIKIPMSKILDIFLYSDGVGLAVDNQKTKLFKLEAYQVDCVYKIISRILDENKV